MLADVRYFSRSGKGNTILLANTVNKVIYPTCDHAKTVNKMLDEKVDLLFLGASVYAGRVDPSVAMFIEYNKDKIGKLVLFGSSCSGKTAYAEIKKLCDKLGVDLCEDTFFCRASFLWFNKGKPDDEDLEKLRQFTINNLTRG